MLKAIRVKNFAIMEELMIDFENGLTVVTGETGAGKSMIVDAISSLCGERIEEISIRSGKNFAEITGIFDTTPAMKAKLEKSGIEMDNELIIRRKLERGKRQTSYINDQIASLNLLKEIARETIDLIGQHENQSLFYPKNHLLLLDAFANIENLKSAYTNDFAEYKNLQNKLEKLREDIKQKDERIDLLKYQINEIEKAQLQPGEEEKLDTEKNLLLSSEKRSSLSSQIITNIYEAEGSAIEKLSKAKKLLSELSSLDPEMSELKKRFDSLISTTDDISRELGSYLDKIEFSQETLDHVLERLEVISKIKKKYGSTLDEINKYLENIKKELMIVETRDEEIQKTKSQLVEKEGRVIKQAEILSTHRRNAAVTLAKNVSRLLLKLGMEKAKYEIKFSEKEVDYDGKDEVEFYISTNPGEELKPLRKIASGGEVSRITLCLKSILSDADRIPTVIFDEVDRGIGGRIAEAVGELLASSSKKRQVICITHLPQISMFADNHYLVKKEIRNKKTFTSIIKLDERMKKLEIARMLGGKVITEKTIEHAEEIVQKGKQK
jgi:DNA repair protein RecN (Recombination protein N)